MLDFDLDAAKEQILAIHYAKKVNNQYVIEFMSSKAEIRKPEDAIEIAKVFWEMTEFAIDDNDNNIEVEGITDLEYWMHNLFNKVSGYLKKNGYEEQWDQVTDEYN